MRRPTTPSEEQTARLDAWLDELDRWGRRANLSRVPRDQAWERHVVESLELLASADPAPGATIVDIGSGAGIPGIPFAIAGPEVRVTLLDADARRTAFLTHVVGLLGIGGVKVVTARAEQAGRSPLLREHFDLAVSRATASASALTELAMPLLRVGGALVALVGDAAAACDAARTAAMVCGGGAPEALSPGILGVAKLRPTPDSHPRREGMAQRRPL